MTSGYLLKADGNSGGMTNMDAKLSLALLTSLADECIEHCRPKRACIESERSAEASVVASSAWRNWTCLGPAREHSATS